MNNYSLEFSIYINDVEYDNDDNEYGEIKLHNYINMKHPLDFVNHHDEGD